MPLLFGQSDFMRANGRRGLVRGYGGEKMPCMEKDFPVWPKRIFCDFLHVPYKSVFRDRFWNGKKIKNSQSRRLVPVPSQLFRGEVKLCSLKLAVFVEIQQVEEFI
jgi:hypothetical protein